MADKDKDIHSLVSKLSKTYDSVDKPVFIKTGSIGLDTLLGGGIPRGNIILWSSGSGIGKSTGALYVCLSYCVQGFKVLYLDYEGGVNDNQLKGIGLFKYKYDKKHNPNGTFFVFRVHTYRDAEVFLNELHDMIDLVVIDSVTSILPSKFLNKSKASIEDVNIGVDSKLVGNLLRRYKYEAIKNGTSWILINQVRTKIRFIGMSTTEEAGGNALKHYPDIRISMIEKKGGKLERKEITPSGPAVVPYGSINTLWCTKSRFVRPFVPISIAFIYGKGISNLYSYEEFLEYRGYIKVSSGRKKGSEKSFKIDLKDGSSPFVLDGMDAMIAWIGDNKDKVREIIKKEGGYKLIFEKGSNVEDELIDDDDPFVGGVYETSIDGEDGEDEDNDYSGFENYDEDDITEQEGSEDEETAEDNT